MNSDHRVSAKIGDFITEAVKEDAAGDLRQRVGPGKGGEYDAHHRGINTQLCGQLRRGNPQHRAVEIVDHGTDRQQRKDTDTPPGRPRAGRGGGRRVIMAIRVHSRFLS